MEEGLDLLLPLLLQACWLPGFPETLPVLCHHVPAEVLEPSSGRVTVELILTYLPRSLCVRARGQGPSSSLLSLQGGSPHLLTKAKAVVSSCGQCGLSPGPRGLCSLGPLSLPCWQTQRIEDKGRITALTPECSLPDRWARLSGTHCGDNRFHLLPS